MDFALEDDLDVIDIAMILFFEGGDFPSKTMCFTLWRRTRKNKNNPPFGAGLVRERHQI
jgi:hypothetical protein